MNRIWISLVLILFICSSLPATQLKLSDHSTNVAINPSLLNAYVTFSVSGTTLSITIDNDSDYYINGVWFNCSANVTGFSNLTGDGPQWNITLARDSITGDGTTNMSGYGSFDARLSDQHMKNKIVAPHSTPKVFTMSIQGTGPFYDNDFSSQLSAGAGIHSFVAVQFDSSTSGNTTPHAAYGILTPEPASITLLASGLILLRRKHSLQNRA